MTVVALASIKHAPGVTTTAVALAAAWGDDTIVVEADPSGGDIATRTRLPTERGLLTLAASGRHPGAPLDVAAHAQPLPSGGNVVVAPASGTRASNALATIGDRLAGGFAGRRGILDCGRIAPGSRSWPAAAGADLLVLVLEPTLAGIEHIRIHLDVVDPRAVPVTALLLVGDRPYGVGSVEAALGVPVLGWMAVDPRGVAAAHAGRRSRRTLLVRTARNVSEAVEQLLDERSPVTR